MTPAILVLIFCLSVLLNKLSAGYAGKLGLMDIPEGDELKIHSRPVPLTGGPAVFLVFTSAVLLSGTFSWFIIPSAIIAATGIVDDRKGISPSLRFKIHILSALISGVIISQLVFNLPHLLFLFAVILIAACINAFNMVDGMDGLCSGLFLISCAGFYAAGRSVGAEYVTGAVLILVPALLGFLIFNFPPASIFLGDSGSGFLGLMAGIFSVLIISGDFNIRKVVAVLLITGLPVADIIFAVLRRLVKGRHPFRGDRSHFYDIMNRKLSVKKTVVISYLMQAVSVLTGIILIK